MTLTLTVPDEALVHLRADAQAQGISLENLAVDRLIAWYEPDPLDAAETREEELAAIGEALRAVEEGRIHPFNGDAILRNGISA